MHGIQQLLEIMAQLRNPDGGCPWDLQQDFESISPYTIEEAYEVDEAIASGDLEALRDELGDLLFQVVFQARIAEERGAFDFEGVTEAIAAKLIRRHPHIFADADTPGTLEAQTASWEAMKEQEREASAGRKDPEAPIDPFAGIPRNLPALARSAKLASRFDRLETAEGREVDRSLEAQREQIRRVVGQLETHLGDAGPPLDRGISLELVGEGIRTWVGLARSLGVDPEQALRQADDGRIEAARAVSAAANVHQAGKKPGR
jgi:ATP diphosphatase